VGSGTDGAIPYPDLPVPSLTNAASCLVGSRSNRDLHLARQNPLINSSGCVLSDFEEDPYPSPYPKLVEA